MAHSRGNFSRSRSSNRRLTAWGVGPHTGSAPSASQVISTSGTTLATVGTSAGVEGLTLIRTRGLLTLQLLTADANGSGFFGAFGLCLVGDEAFAAGVTAVPDPQDDTDDERWYYHTFFNIRTNAATTVEIGKQGMAQLVLEVDSKAMRKEPSDLVEVAVLGHVEVGAATMNWDFACRTLNKLA